MKDGNDDPVCKTAKKTQMCIADFWTDADAETPILRSPDVKNCLIGKDPDAVKEWRQEEKFFKFMKNFKLMAEVTICSNFEA